MRLSGILFILLFAVSLNASSSRVSEKSQTQDLRFGLQLSQLTLPTGSLAGFGPVAGFDYFLNRKVSLGLSLTQSYGSQDSGSSVLFTGVTGEGSYALIGANKKGRRQVEAFGHRTIDVDYGQSTRILVGASMTQLFLNGTSTVYPASGPGGHIRSNFFAFGEEWSAEAKYSLLLSGNYSFGGVFLTLGWVLNL